MPILGPYKNLDVWKKSMNLAKEVYRVTAKFPSTEIYGITNQMRRSSVSIPSNIAEGYGRGTNTELVRFLNIAMGSSNELDTQIELSYSLGFMDQEEYEYLSGLNNDVNKMIYSLIYYRQTKVF